MLLVNFQPTHYSAINVVKVLEHLEWSARSELGNKVCCPCCGREKFQGHLDNPIAASVVGASDFKPGEGVCMLHWVLKQARKEVLDRTDYPPGAEPR
jgi:hypothetical protein